MVFCQNGSFIDKAALLNKRLLPELCIGFFLKWFINQRCIVWQNLFVVLCWMQQMLLGKKGTRIFFHSPFNFQEWKNSSKIILVFLISDQHFKSKLSYVKLNKHESKTVCNSSLLFLVCFWFWVDSRVFWFVLHYSASSLSPKFTHWAWTISDSYCSKAVVLCKQRLS